MAPPQDRTAGSLPAAPAPRPGPRGAEGLLRPGEALGTGFTAGLASSLAGSPALPNPTISGPPLAGQPPTGQPLPGQALPDQALPAQALPNPALAGQEGAPPLRLAGFGFRTHLLRLALALALPLAVLAGALALWTAREQRAEVLRGLQHTAHALQLAVDRELRAGIAALEVLGGMPGLDPLLAGTIGAEEFAALHAQASALLRRPATGLRSLTVVSAEEAGQPPRLLLSTVSPPGAQPSRPPALRFAPRADGSIPDPIAPWIEALRSPLPRITDLFQTPLDPHWRFAITLPLQREGRTIGLLVGTLGPERIAAILQEHQPPAGWEAMVVDRVGHPVARSTGNAAGLIGAGAAEPLLAETLPAAVGAFQAGPLSSALLTLPDEAGGQAYAALRRLAGVPWSVLYAAPQSEVDGPQWRALGLAGAAGAAALALAALLALRIGRLLGAEIRGLGRDAASVALSEAPPPPRPPALVREVAEARASLAQVAETLRQRAAAKRDSEARQVLLMREVDHRAKNALAVALSLVRLAPRDVPPEHFAATAEGRLAAMARAHALLAERAWEGAPLRELALGEFAAAAPDALPGRIPLEGPAVLLDAVAVQPLAMLLHELATNARRHGALSRQEGHVLLHWELAADGALRLHWREQGGPALQTAPPRGQFGSRLIRQLAERQLGGRLRAEWRPEGLSLALSLPRRSVVPPRAATPGPDDTLRRDGFAPASPAQGLATGVAQPGTAAHPAGGFGAFPPPSPAG
ncbi:sensor histidine kinase [Pseudoroseomonas cervicalis]|uniref:sensor histidine kinase n=1 Tax=Teichococcus cervicalis TaxID=204525 RepID=UPI0027D92EEA|nr:sensor histidine kinase [Pseudoroseomonas cervicalis]